MFPKDFFIVFLTKRYTLEMLKGPIVEVTLMFSFRLSFDSIYSRIVHLLKSCFTTNQSVRTGLFVYSLYDGTSTVHVTAERGWTMVQGCLAHWHLVYYNSQWTPRNMAIDVSVHFETETTVQAKHMGCIWEMIDAVPIYTFTTQVCTSINKGSSGIMLNLLPMFRNRAGLKLGSTWSLKQKKKKR